MNGFDALTLRCFLAVAEAKSITHATSKVNRTQSAVSQQIAKLESQIGKSLFLRNKNFTLTADGEIFFNYARQIMKLQQEAFDRLNQPDLQGEIRFGLPEDFANVFLSDILAEYIASHPRISLNVDCDLTLNLFRRFKNKEFDLVLVKMSKPEDFPNGVDVYSEPLEWVGRKENFFIKSQSIPLILSPPPCVYRTRAIHSLDKLNKRWRIAFSSHSYTGKIAAVKADIGVTVLPRNMIPKGIQLIAREDGIPLLDDTHISLLKHGETNLAVNSIEKFMLHKLRQ